MSSWLHGWGSKQHWLLKIVLSTRTMSLSLCNDSSFGIQRHSLVVIDLQAGIHNHCSVNIRTSAPDPANGTVLFHVATTITVPSKEVRFRSDLTRLETLSSTELENELCPVAWVSYQTSPNVVTSISLQYGAAMYELKTAGLLTLGSSVAPKWRNPFPNEMIPFDEICSKVQTI